MLRYILIFTIFVASVVNAQKETEVLAYVPLKTIHYSEGNWDEYVKGEGGNIGLIGIYRRTNGKTFSDIQGGVIRNSYGNLSITVQKGWGVYYKRFTASINIGLISGYKNLYEKEKIGTDELGREGYWEREDSFIDKFPKIMKDNGILPSCLISVNYYLCESVAPTINFSPNFINLGVTFKVY